MERFWSSAETLGVHVPIGSDFFFFHFTARSWKSNRCSLKWALKDSEHASSLNRERTFTRGPRHNSTTISHSSNHQKNGQENIFTPINPKCFSKPANDFYYYSWGEEYFWCVVGWAWECHHSSYHMQNNHSTGPAYEQCWGWENNWKDKQGGDRILCIEVRVLANNFLEVVCFEAVSHTIQAHGVYLHVRMLLPAWDKIFFMCVL